MDESLDVSLTSGQRAVSRAGWQQTTSISTSPVFDVAPDSAILLVT